MALISRPVLSTREDSVSYFFCQPPQLSLVLHSTWSAVSEAHALLLFRPVWSTRGASQPLFSSPSFFASYLLALQTALSPAACAAHIRPFGPPAKLHSALSLLSTLLSFHWHSTLTGVMPEECSPHP